MDLIWRLDPVFHFLPLSTVGSWKLPSTFTIGPYLILPRAPVAESQICPGRVTKLCLLTSPTVDFLFIRPPPTSPVAPDRKQRFLLLTAAWLPSDVKQFVISMCQAVFKLIMVCFGLSAGRQSNGYLRGR